MGISFSIDHSITPSGFSGKAIMAFTYQSGTFKPISFMDFIDSPSSFTSCPLVMIEPTHGARPPNTKLGCPPSVSYVETSRDLHQMFKISQFKFASFRLWLLVSCSISSNLVADVIADCRTFPFTDYFSTKAVAADDLFFDISNVGSFAAAFKPPSQCGGLRSSSPLRTAAQLNSNTFIVRRSHEAVALQTTFHVPNNGNINNSNNINVAQQQQNNNAILKANDCDFVITGLFIGGEAAARNRGLLERLGITHVVNLNSGDSLVDEFDNFEYCSVLLNDSVFEDLTPDFWNAVQFIDKAIRKDNGVVLVHCRRGISRSAALCVAYLMDCRGMKLESAINLVKKQRPAVNINQGFIEQLQNHEEQKCRVAQPTPRKFDLKLSVF